MSWVYLKCGQRFITGGSDQKHPQEKEMQKGKMVIWGGFTNSWERREAKGKGQKERHTHLDAEFKRIARRDKRAFLSECKEIEEHSWMGKTRYLFRRIRDTKGTFYAKMVTINDGNGMDLIEDTRKMWQEYTEEFYEKDLNDLDNRDGVITHL